MTKVSVRRQWNDWQIGEVDFHKLENWHWSQVSGGMQAPAPQTFVHAYAWCTDIEGEIAHSGLHDSCPHRIKVVITRKYNEKIWDKILEKVGPRRE